MRRFLVQDWSCVEKATIVWCKGEVCHICRLRFDCWTSNDDFVLLKKKSALGAYEFKGCLLPSHIEGIRQDGCRLGMRIETLIEYLIAGENKVVPDEQWSQGWVYQAGCQCPQPQVSQVLDKNYNKELKALLFPCNRCKESFICKATNRYLRGGKK